MPCGKKIPTKRDGGLAAVWASSVRAGIIASNSGSAKVTPAPRRKVRRGMCFFVRYMMAVSFSTSDPLLAVGLFDVHLERGAPHDAEHQRGKPVVAAGCVPHERSH